MNRKLTHIARCTLLAAPLCLLPVDGVVAGLLSPDAVMYGLSRAEAESLAPADVTAEGAAGPNARDESGRDDSPERTQSELISQPGLSSTTAGAMAPGPDGPPTGSGAAVWLAGAPVRAHTIVTYLSAHPTLLLPVPFLDGIFRPPRSVAA